MKDIASLDELMAYAAQISRQEAEFEQVRITAPSLGFRIKVDGRSWNGRFDPRHARYLIALQESMDTVLQDVSADAILDEPAMVRTDIQDGSSDLFHDLAEFVKPMVANMTDTQTFIAIMTSIAAAAGYFAWSRWLDHKTEVSHETTKRHIVDALRPVAENDPGRYAPLEKPMRVLSSTLEKNDTVAIDEAEGMDVQELRKSLPRRRRTEAQTSYADGPYTLKSIDFSIGELILHLIQDDVPLKAYTSQLSQEDADKLFDDIKGRQAEEDMPFSIDLQVNVRHTARNIQHGSVIGLGAPRENKRHVKLTELIPGTDS